MATPKVERTLVDCPRCSRKGAPAEDGYMACTLCGGACKVPEDVAFIYSSKPEEAGQAAKTWVEMLKNDRTYTMIVYTCCKAFQHKVVEACKTVARKGDPEADAIFGVKA